MIKKIILNILATILVSSVLYSGEPAEIVTVDGLSFVNTLLLPGSNAIDDSQPYLKVALDGMNLNLPDTAVTAFPWSRDANDTEETVEELRVFLKQKYQTAKQAGKRFIVVAHSWGTVLTYLALSSQSNQVEENERVYVDLYITLGSPLGTDLAHSGTNYPEETIVIDYTADWVNRYSFCDTCIPLVDKWVNYWAWGDVISGPFDGFMPFSGNPRWDDIRVDSSNISSGYLTRNTSSTVIWHKYDSLQSGGVVDNQPLLDAVKELIEDNDSVSDDPPFGSFDTPTEGDTVRSSIAVTGWALDDNSVESVKIYRDPVDGEGTSRVYIGNATFVEGARPDVQQAYPGYPYAGKAGWGYMLLTNFLPNNGNGPITLYAIAIDNAGQNITLGSKSIICDNAHAVKPFGAIDTPTQGGTASGTDFVNWGWVLTPQPNMVPVDGSTINVWIDGVNVGQPAYNIYRSDIATKFPDYANSQGAVGYFYLDTTAYENGVHTIQWTAKDDAGNSDGIGSRYFTINNSSSKSILSTVKNTEPKTTNLKIPIEDISLVRYRKGYCQDSPLQTLFPDKDGTLTIQLKSTERLEIHFEEPVTTLTPLPIGSTFDTHQHTFHWQPGPVFKGIHKIQFFNLKKNLLKTIKVTIN